MCEHKKTKLVISCFYDAASTDQLPVGFSWIEILLEQYSSKYKVTILLHGNCLKFGLRCKPYFEKYHTNNPYADFLKKMHKLGAKIVICDLCLHRDGFSNEQLLKFVKPIPFSIDFIAQSQLKGALVVYDATLSR